MRLVWPCLFASTLAFAAPQKPVRKSAPPELPADQIDDFADAVIADKRGDFGKAISEYERLDKKLPNVAYNMADLYRRMERWDRAVEYYKKYLELAPNAPDKAAVQKLIDQIAKTPTTLVVDGDDLDAVVFIDGKLVGPSPLVQPLADGWHAVDRIGPESYAHRLVKAAPMVDEHLEGYYDRNGNVVMSTNVHYGGSWDDGGNTFQMDGRFTLAPGRYDTFFFKPKLACSPISFEVPADGLVFVYIDGPEQIERGKCTPVTVRTQKIQFPKAKP